MTSDFERWVEKQPRDENNKVSALLLVQESQRRGYCVCPKDIRRIIFFQGCSCSWCGQEETKASYDFYYTQTED